MTWLVAAFETPEAAISGADKLRSAGFPPDDALTPFRVEKLEQILKLHGPPIRTLMAGAALLTAGIAYGVEWFSASYAYPIDSGGRPYNSWPVFVLFPFEAGFLVAALAGFILFLIYCKLPSLYHPLFALQGIERASSDRFFLIVNATADESIRLQLRMLLDREGAITIEEMLR